MVMGLHFDNKGLVFNYRVIAMVLRIRKKASPLCCSFKNGRIIRIGHKSAGRVLSMRLSDHRKKRARLLFAIDNPVRVENLVSTVL